MNRHNLSFLPLVLLASVAVPAHGQNLLGIVGGSGEDALVTIGSGSASDSGLVNVGVGGGSQLVDVQVGGKDSNIAGATVGTGGGSLVDANVDLLDGNANVNATVGGGSLATVGVSVGGGGKGGGTGNGGGNGGNGGNANPGGNGNAGGNGGGNGPVLSANRGGGSSGGLPASCSGTNPSQVQRLIQNTKIGANWQRASNVTIRRVDLCPELQSWLASALSSSGIGPSLHSAIDRDSLLSASLDRSSYNTNRVFAVQQRGNQLTVFVY